MLEQPLQPDWQGLVNCIQRQGTPQRVFNMELYLDREVQDAVAARFDLVSDIDPTDTAFSLKKMIRVQRRLGYDSVRQGIEGLEMRVNRTLANDTAELTRNGGRSFVESTHGPITCWAEFERYPWPDPAKASTKSLEWYEKNLPEDMCVCGSGGFAHFAEHLIWLMGYEALSIALVEDPALVQAIADRLMDYNVHLISLLLQFSRVKLIFGSDDMGFRTGTLIHPRHLRQYILPGHKKMAAMAHAAGRPYLLHTCGNVRAIMPDLIKDVGIDAKHSFEDTIETVQDAKRLYGQDIAVIGGIDVDFLCRASEEEVRARTRQTLRDCHPGGGYCLGTGNSVANYIPLDNYLAMLDEGRRFG
jgi:uroporphyrinogen decarboxylase